MADNASEAGRGADGAEVADDADVGNASADSNVMAATILLISNTTSGRAMPSSSFFPSSLHMSATSTWDSPVPLWHVLLPSVAPMVT